jgi:maleate isomerase
MGGMARRIRLGFLTPSSNTTLEPVTAAMLAGLPEVSAHFARFPVTEIALSAGALGQFDPGPILAAARLLAHARVDVIAWNGTSASWLGFETDAALCAAITAETGIAATTSILAMNELIGRLGVRALGLVTPYLAEVQARIVANYRALGLHCDAERHCGLRDNFAFAEVADGELQAMTRAVAAGRPDAIAPDAIAVVCTNLRAAPLVAALEAETGVVMLDSIATVVWKSLALAGADPARVAGWGRLFAVAP